MTKVAIIGAGLAGLTCAERLKKAGCQVVLYEKSRGLGGRLATRRNGSDAFDHGAQFVKARRPEFRTFLERTVTEGAAQAWDATARAPQDAPWYVGLPGMSGLMGPLSRDLPIETEKEVAGLQRGPAGLRLRFLDESQSAPFDRIVAAIPAEQAGRVLAGETDLTTRLAAVTMAPCWTVMARFAASSTLPWNSLMPKSEILAWAALDSSKPGRRDVGASLVLQATAAWTRANYEMAKEEVAIALLGELHQISDMDVGTPVLSLAHRWRYALTERPLGLACLYDAGAGIGICGDWCLGDRAEDAFNSGLAMAIELLRRP